VLVRTTGASAKKVSATNSRTSSSYQVDPIGVRQIALREHDHAVLQAQQA